MVIGLGPRQTSTRTQVHALRPEHTIAVSQQYSQGAPREGGTAVAPHPTHPHMARKTAFLQACLLPPPLLHWAPRRPSPQSPVWAHLSCTCGGSSQCRLIHSSPQRWAHRVTQAYSMTSLSPSFCELAAWLSLGRPTLLCVSTVCISLLRNAAAAAMLALLES